MKPTARLVLTAVALFALTVGLAPWPTHAGPADVVVVYTTYENDEAVRYLAELKREIPSLEVRLLRLSTGELAARILAERDNPQADVIWGLAVTRLIPLAQQGVLDPYKPKGFARIPLAYRDNAGFWIAADMFIGALGVNREELRRRNIPMPKSYADLLDPRLKGLIVMPNPATSGTGFIHVSTWLLGMGEQRGWDYMKRLDANMAQYTRSGAAPGRLAAQGEIPVGLTLTFPILQFKKEGFPVDVVFPTEGVGYEMEGHALVKGARNPAAARRFLDWSISDNAFKLLAEYHEAVTLPGIEGGKGLGLQPIKEIPLIKMNARWQAENLNRILEQWARTFQR
jgi:iron(III) transport system substrate-binding protein